MSRRPNNIDKWCPRGRSCPGIGRRRARRSRRGTRSCRRTAPRHWSCNRCWNTGRHCPCSRCGKCTRHWHHNCPCSNTRPWSNHRSGHWHQGILECNPVQSGRACTLHRRSWCTSENTTARQCQAVRSSGPILCRSCRGTAGSAGSGSTCTTAAPSYSFGKDEGNSSRRHRDNCMNMVVGRELL